MKTFTRLDLDELAPIGPREPDGKFVSKSCPVCGNGTLVYEGLGIWRCDGLADPEDENKPLVACEYTHADARAADRPGRSVR